MKSLLWLVKASVLPVLALALLAWWSSAAIVRTGGEGMAWWACVLLFGGLGISALLPRVAVLALYGAFVLQLVRADSRFDQAGWLPYAAVFLVAAVLAARTPTARARRVLVALLPLGVLIGLFTNLPSLGPVVWMNDDGSFRPAYSGASGLVNGKSWAPITSIEGMELLVGLLVWSAGSVLLVVAGWMAGSTYRARRLQWEAEAASAAARAALSASEHRLQVTEERDRIAQDVHDITAHSLSVILAQADGAAAHVTDATARSALSTIASSARVALTELRGLLEHLEQQTDGDTARSTADLPELVATVRATGRAVEYVESGSAVPLTRAAGLAAYRIVQEALTNAIRHGTGTGPIRVVLDWTRDGVAITVTSSVDPRRGGERAAPGRGLVGMQQRARLAGGWLTSGVDDETARYLVTAHLPATAAVVA
ncbi:sensor histidine kinase [Amnibacterium setariae]|uniref:histidine kinase n=1 Tax=Amnibacterium setariae TaxID=2306585 RepID=A0A3A1U3W7_9MICO|nr:histidine kinase [Amnibacterium setariae]RIX31072.1 hypothetical protein D1781_06785 [Amnibacterium setariae]